MKFLKLIFLTSIFLVACDNNNLDSSISELDEVPDSSEASKYTGIPLDVSSEYINNFINQSELLGLKQVEPDNLFFVNLVANGFSIQLEGQNPENVTGAMIDISYVGNNFGMGRGTIIALVDILLNEEINEEEANNWITQQIVNSDLSLNKGITPEISQFEIENLIIEFFPPTSLEDLNAVILIFASEHTKESQSSLSLTNSEDSYDNSIDINNIDEDGVTQLARASSKGDMKLIKMLLEQGADPNLYEGYGEPPLLWAVRSNQDDVVKVLLEAGADPNIKSIEGMTPLMIAVEEEANATVEYLKEFGAK